MAKSSAIIDAAYLFWYLFTTLFALVEGCTCALETRSLQHKSCTLVAARAHLRARLAPAQQLQAILSHCAIGIPTILLQHLPLHTHAP